MVFSRAHKLAPSKGRGRGGRKDRPRTLFLRAPEQLERREMLDGQPFGAMPDDTAEYMLGDVYVTVVFMESAEQTGPFNNNSETWTTAAKEAVKQNIREGLNWWTDTLAARTDKHELNFEIDFTFADSPVVTSYEPITRPSTDFRFWIYDFLNVVGYNNRGNFSSDIRAFNNAQRELHEADWAFTIFVVNDANDSDKQFAPGGFSKAFAFAGGELIVSPAARPASTYAHEAGHQFWALDEYDGAGDFSKRRGYYNSQNTNARNNPAPGFIHEPSIMSNGESLDIAYLNHTSAQSTLELIGWKDSDGDGIFDVLDVPLLLTGSGFYDASSGEYRFTGSSAVQTIPNKNSSGLQNDITINKVSRAEYRIDGGAWQTAATYSTSTADLDLRIPVSPSASQIEIRTIDAVTGITSPIFQGSVSRPSSVLLPGINGIVWRDHDRDGVVDAGEPGMAGVTVQLVDQSGQPLDLRKTIEPDNFNSGTRLNTVIPEVTISAFGTGVGNDTVSALNATNASTGSRIFSNSSSACAEGLCTDWTPESRQMRMDFTAPVSTISLDAIGTTVAGYARLEIYGANNELLARYTTQQLSDGEVETMTLNRPTADIKYAIARGHANTAVRLDNLRFGPESTTTTDANGTYSLPYVSSGVYQVQVVLGIGQSATNPNGGSQSIALGEGEFKGGADFGIAVEASRWQNPTNRFDVNGDGTVAPLDVLAVINSLNRDGTRSFTEADPTPPYLDVNGDFVAAPIDALQIINELNGAGGGGESAASYSSIVAGPSSGSQGSAEGEALLDKLPLFFAEQQVESSLKVDSPPTSSPTADDRDEVRRSPSVSLLASGAPMQRDFDGPSERLAADQYDLLELDIDFDALVDDFVVETARRWEHA